MKVLSYNIWFDEKDRLNRLESLLAVITYYDPDIICLQEVIPSIHTRIMDNLKCYTSFPYKLDKTYGCVILSKLDIKNKQEYIFDKSVMGRNLLLIGVKIDDELVYIANCHYESMFKIKTKNVEKLNQYTLSKKILDTISEKNKVVLCADTNILKVEEESFFNDNKWIDSWEVCKDKKQEFTFDYTTNSHMKDKKLRFRSRLDRILYNGSFKLNQFFLIRGIEGFIQPSDHHGVMVELA